MDDIDPAEISEFGLSGAPKGPSGARYFDENQAHPDATTDYKSHHNFDWEALAYALGETKERTAEDFEKMAQGLRVLLRWVLQIPSFRNKPKPTAEAKLAFVGRRVIALCWSLNPDLLEGESIRGLERKLGLPRNILSPITADARRDFDLKNRAQGHGWNFKETPDPENCP